MNSSIVFPDFPKALTKGFILRCKVPFYPTKAIWMKRFEAKPAQHHTLYTISFSSDHIF